MLNISSDNSSDPHTVYSMYIYTVYNLILLVPSILSTVHKRLETSALITPKEKNADRKSRDVCWLLFCLKIPNLKQQQRKTLSAHNFTLSFQRTFKLPHWIMREKSEQRDTRSSPSAWSDWLNSSAVWGTSSCPRGVKVRRVHFLRRPFGTSCHRCTVRRWQTGAIRNGKIPVVMAGGLNLTCWWRRVF